MKNLENKDDLDILSLDEQIQAINGLVKEYGSLTKVCNKIGVARSTINKRFSKHGYKFSKENKEYIKTAQNDSITEFEQNTDAQLLDKNNSRNLKNNTEEKYFEIIDKLIEDNQKLQTRIKELESKLNVSTTKQKANDPEVTTLLKVRNREKRKGGRKTEFYYQIKDLFLKGYSYNEIQEKLNCNYSTVAKSISKIKYEMIKTLYSKGCTIEEIMEDTNSTKDKVILTIKKIKDEIEK